MDRAPLSHAEGCHLSRLGFDRNRRRPEGIFCRRLPRGPGRQVSGVETRKRVQGEERRDAQGAELGIGNWELRTRTHLTNVMRHENTKTRNKPTYFFSYFRAFVAIRFMR